VDDVEEEPAPAIAHGTQGETVLVVEDDPDVRNYSADTLRELGYRVLEAPDARAGLQLLGSHPEIQILFTDVGLPGGMNGRQLAEEARRIMPNLKVLFTTGYARNAIVHDGRLDPGVELLPKPFTQAALADKLRNIIDARAVPARVLLIEDEVLIQMLAAEYLEDMGLKVDVATTATDALNKLGLVPGGVDAIVMDMGLPDRRGDSLVHEIRSIYPSVPIVIASGLGQKDLRDIMKDTPMVTFVYKPFTAEDLRAALRGAGLRF
jgi:CheY-like chemotaxis protein